jgi:hypothetical protein
MVTVIWIYGVSGIKRNWVHQTRVFNYKYFIYLNNIRIACSSHLLTCTAQTYARIKCKT